MNLGKVEIWETSLDRIVTLREGAEGVLRPSQFAGAIRAGVLHDTSGKKTPACPLVRISTIQATDLETAKGVAHFLIFEGTNTVEVVLDVVED